MAAQGRLGIRHAGCGRLAPNRPPDALVTQVLALAQVGVPPAPHEPELVSGKSFFCIATPNGTNPFDFGFGGVRPDEQVRIANIALDRPRKLLLRS